MVDEEVLQGVMGGPDDPDLVSDHWAMWVKVVEYTSG
jgi:hypothetical protein